MKSRKAISIGVLIKMPIFQNLKFKLKAKEVKISPMIISEKQVIIIRGFMIDSIACAQHNNFINAFNYNLKTMI